MQRNVSLYIAASLDGFIARRDGSLDWLPSSATDEDYGYGKFWAGIDTVVMGRKTYDAAREREQGPPFAGRECIVFSRRRAGTRLGRTQFVADDPAETLRRLRREEGRGIWLVGGGEVARDCLDAGVVSEIVLTVVPVLLGDGVSLFRSRAGTTWLSLRSSRNYGDGVVQLTYALRARRAAEPLHSDARNVPVGTVERASSREAAAALGAGMVRAWSLRARAA